MIVTDLKTLRQVSTPVETVFEARAIIAMLKDELKKHDSAIGLSAIQIGIPKQVSIINTKDKQIVLINAKIVEAADPFVFIGEGCLSMPGKYCDTARFKDITIDNYVFDDDPNIVWDSLSQKAFRVERQNYQTEEPQKDLAPIAIQHELDHFAGKVFWDNEQKNVPYVAPVKIGRNDPCNCGSGKKFKKCCGK